MHTPTMHIQRNNFNLLKNTINISLEPTLKRIQSPLLKFGSEHVNKSYLRSFCSSISRCCELKILGIETSCDDTSAAIINNNGVILAEHTMNQFHIHEPMGGIVPNLALRSHTVNLPTVVATTLEKANLSVTDIDIFAFTRGPGIPACLSVGTNATKTLAASLRKPLIGVHHMEAHALTVRMGQDANITFPYVAFLISGGHTLVIIVHGVNQYTQLAATLDESVGEAYDKVARALCIPWNPVPGKEISELVPGRGGGPGPALEKAALDGDKTKYTFTLPLNLNQQRANMAFSFSGLRTQVEKKTKELFTNIGPNKKAKIVADVAASFQHTVIKHLETKLKLALIQCRKLGVSPTALVASGGVASNLSIRKMLDGIAAENAIPLYCPPIRLCTDNGAMIAWAGWERYRLGLIDHTTINFLPNWPLEDLKEMYSSPSAVDTTYPILC